MNRSRICLLLMLTVGACGGQDEGAVTPPLTVESVVVTPATLGMSISRFETVHATVLNADGQHAGTAVSWASSDPSVALVYGFGDSANVVAVAPGISSVRATSRGRSGEVVVTVVPPQQLLTVVIDGDGQGSVRTTPQGLLCQLGTCFISFEFGTSVTLDALPASGSALTRWSGPCTGTGACTVVMNQPQTVTATINVYPRRVASIDVTPSLLVLDEGQQGILTATPRDADGNALTERDIIWMSTNPDRAPVSATGEVTAILEGDTLWVNARHDAINGEATVVVQALSFRSFSMGTGAEHSCAHRVLGGMYCWGSAGNGRLGNPANPGGGARIPVVGSKGFIYAAAAGDTHSCAVANTQAVYCWGSGEKGELGDGRRSSSDVPVRVASELPFYIVATGRARSCAVAQTGIHCWGDNDQGVLGVGSAAATVDAPTLVSGGLIAGEIHMGLQHTCAAVSAPSFALYCWGGNEHGQLGTGDRLTRTGPVQIQGMGAVFSVGTGREHTCAIDSNFTAWCWGLNNRGQLGDGTFTTRLTPVRVSTNLSLTRVVAGQGHTCATTTAKEVYCWGENALGQLGNGTNTNSNLPVKVSGDAKFYTMRAGANHTCGLTSRGDMVCWGSNQTGQLGLMTAPWSNVMVAVPRP